MTWLVGKWRVDGRVKQHYLLRSPHHPSHARSPSHLAIRAVNWKGLHSSLIVHSGHPLMQRLYR